MTRPQSHTHLDKTRQGLFRPGRLQTNYQAARKDFSLINTSPEAPDQQK